MAFRRLVERQSEENPEKNHVSISFLKISTCEKKKKTTRKPKKEQQQQKQKTCCLRKTKINEYIKLKI